ncbi:MAG: beta-propeller domain-containing protein [Pyrinomonadaceae bacterium]
MKNSILSVLVLLLAAGSFLFSYTAINGSKSKPRLQKKTRTVNNQSDTLTSFESQKELDGFLAELKAERERRQNNTDLNSNSNTSSSNSATVDVAAAPSPSSYDKDSVTNVQHAGVDEGGIVKLHKDHLIILCRGRLFTVAIGGDQLRPVSSIDAFGPDIDPSGTWYDEMLVSGNTIAVIGYGYQRGGTEIGIFNITDRGGLSYRSTYHLRSNDYYSSRNYASRLIGSKLIFYSPLYLGYSEDPMEDFPAIRKWHKGATEKEFKLITAPTRVYKPVYDLTESYYAALHTVTVCDLGASDLKCEATSVIGPAGRVFYVSPNSVYVWTTDWRAENAEERSRSVLYQMPLDGSAPTALGVSGSPVDQFSFLESGDDHLNVLVRSEGSGDGMWNAEMTDGDAALLRFPRSEFGNGRKSLNSDRYQSLKAPDGYYFQNRFVGDHLLYGSGSSWEAGQRNDFSTLYSVNWRTGKTGEFPLNHTVDRIEGMGSDAVIVGGNKNDLYFSPLKLGDSPSLKESYIRKNAQQGEERSHGFFYKPNDSGSGTLGLPIISGGEDYGSYFRGSASILFLRNAGLKFSEMGTLKAGSSKKLNDRCRASCVDWYGNARPLFVRGRIFALLGYEIVEGTETATGIKEKQRRSFSPAG